MKNIIPHYIIVFGIGAFGYGGIEILYRGHTHPTMLFAGGIALLSLFEISKHDIPLSIKAILGGGDIVAAAAEYKEQVYHASTGGGATLEYLEGKILPGIEIIK